MDFRKLPANPTNEYRRLGEVYAATGYTVLEDPARDPDRPTRIEQEILEHSRLEESENEP